MIGCLNGTYGDVTLVFDHCHEHGWTRGVLCNSCNVKLGYLETAMAIKGVRVDLGVTPYAKWIAQCPDCTEVVATPGRAHSRPPRTRRAP